MSNSSIWSRDRTLSGATNYGLSGPGSDSNEEVLHIPQSSSIAEASPSDCLESYPGHSLRESYPSAVMQSVYSTASADWVQERRVSTIYRSIYLNNLVKLSLIGIILRWDFLIWESIFFLLRTFLSSSW